MTEPRLSDADREYLCPKCRAKTSYADGSKTYNCQPCNLTFPVLFGIPDFRLTSDHYLSLEQERDKARRLYEFGRDHSFDELVDEYYRITDDVPPKQAIKFAKYVRAGVMRGAVTVPKLAPPASGRLLDVGCGAGGLVAAAAAAKYQVCGTDIALRWLVIAAKRLEEMGLEAELVCADLSALPFADAQFSDVAAIDLIEHLEDADTGVQNLSRMLRPGGKVHLAAANRYTLARYPLAGLFGVGFMPKRLRRRYVIARRGLDTLRYANLQSPLGLARRLRRHRFTQVHATALEIPDARPGTLLGLQKIMLPLYSRLRTLPLIGRIMLLTGPAFEISALKTPGPR